VGGAGKFYRRDFVTGAWTSVAAKPGGGNLPAGGIVAVDRSDNQYVAVLDNSTMNRIFVYTNPLAPGTTINLTEPYLWLTDLTFWKMQAQIAGSRLSVASPLVDMVDGSGAVKDVVVLDNAGALGLLDQGAAGTYVWSVGWDDGSGVDKFLHRIRMEEE
jgi:hypothetical protein